MAYKDPNAIRRRNKILAPIVAILIIFAFLLSAAAGFLLVKAEIDGIRALGSNQIIVEVAEGASLGEVSKTLSEKGVINSSLVFDMYIRLMGGGSNVQYGPHQVSSDMTYDAILESLATPYIVEVPGTPITFPEGVTSLKMAMMLEDEGYFTIQEFVDECNNGTFTGELFPLIDDNPDKFMKLEGFLFPETYMYYEGMTVNEFIQQMLDTFELRVMTEENMAAVEASSLSFEELIVLASIVEKESVGAESYPMVASVFYNRMADPEEYPYIQSDTSTDWVARGITDWYGGYYPGVLEYYYGSYENIPAGTRAGYDTYTVEGLIIGAICNPGLTAIEGVLFPADTNYFFFFTDADKNFYWNETFEQHVIEYEIHGPN